MNAVSVFRRFVDEMFLKYGLSREKSASLVLLGRELESFKGFYAELSARVLKPLTEQLPDRGDLLKTIREAIEGEGRKQTRVQFNFVLPQHFIHRAKTFLVVA